MKIQNFGSIYMQSLKQKNSDNSVSSNNNVNSDSIGSNDAQRKLESQMVTSMGKAQVNFKARMSKEEKLLQKTKQLLSEGYSRVQIGKLTHTSTYDFIELCDKNGIKPKLYMYESVLADGGLPEIRKTNPDRFDRLMHELHCRWKDSPVGLEEALKEDIKEGFGTKTLAELAGMDEMEVFEYFYPYKDMTNANALNMTLNTEAREIAMRRIVSNEGLTDEENHARTKDENFGKILRSLYVKGIKISEMSKTSGLSSQEIVEALYKGMEDLPRTWWSNFEDEEYKSALIDMYENKISRNDIRKRTGVTKPFLDEVINEHLALKKKTKIKE